MRISDWSSDVCSSDLLRRFAFLGAQEPGAQLVEEGFALIGLGSSRRPGKGAQIQIGRWPRRSGPGRQEVVVDGLNFPGLRFGVEHEPLAHYPHPAAPLANEAGHPTAMIRGLVVVESPVIGGTPELKSGVWDKEVY